MRLAAETELDAVVDEPFPLQALADAASSQQIDGALLQHTGAQGGFDLGSAARFEDYGFDSREVQQVREHQPRGARADDADLGSLADHRQFRMPEATRPVARAARATDLRLRLNRLIA